jgi:hypothetical protein
MIFRRLSPDTLAACAALHRRRRVLRARVQTLQACSDALHRTMSQVDSGDIQLGRQVADALGHVLELPCPFIAPVTLPRHTSGATHPRHALRQ